MIAIVTTEEGQEYNLEKTTQTIDGDAREILLGLRALCLHRRRITEIVLAEEVTT